jgi:hypothetical protein
MLGGTCSACFDPLRELFAAKLESGDDLSASLALSIDGEMVVDVWGGWADESRTVPWTEQSRFAPNVIPSWVAKETTWNCDPIGGNQRSRSGDVKKLNPVDWLAFD